MIKCHAAFIYGWSNVIDNVKVPFPGNASSPALEYTGIYSNQRNGFLATAVGGHFLLTANHVNYRPGDMLRNNRGEFVKVIEVTNLKYPNGTTSDLTLIRTEQKMNFYYSIIDLKPANGSPSLSVGRSVANGNYVGYQDVSSFQYNIANNKWEILPTQEVFNVGSATRYSGLTWFQGIYTTYSGLINDTSLDWFMSYTIPINKDGYGMASPGDSGGPTFVLQDGEWKIASIISFTQSQGIANVLGSGGPPIHSFLNQLGHVAVPEPHVFWMAAGLVILGVTRKLLTKKL